MIKNTPFESLGEITYRASCKKILSCNLAGELKFYIRKRIVKPFKAKKRVYA